MVDARCPADTLNKAYWKLAVKLRLDKHPNLSREEKDKKRYEWEKVGLAYQILDDLRPYAMPATLVRHEDIIDRVITAPVAAARTLFPKQDPFELVLHNQHRREQALQRCQHWLEDALQEAKCNADALPAPIANVVTHFISDHLNTVTNRSGRGQNSYRPWQPQHAASIKAV